MSSEIMAEVSGGDFASFGALAAGFQRFCVRDEQYPGMVAAPAGDVEGVVYENIDPEAVTRLDIFEGDMYARQVISVVRKSDQARVEVMAYIVKPEYRHLLTEKNWSYEEFLATGKRLFTERYVGFREIEDK